MPDKQKKLKKKINRLSDKHRGLYGAVVEGYGQNKYTSGNYDKDTEKLYRVEDKLTKKEKKYTKKYGASPYDPIKMKNNLKKDASYDAKEAYNKNLSGKARLHYLENNIADRSFMSKHSHSK